MRIQMVKYKEKLCFRINDSVSFYYFGCRYTGTIIKMHVITHCLSDTHVSFRYIMLLKEENRYFIIVYDSKTNRKYRGTKPNKNLRCSYDTTYYGDAKLEMNDYLGSYKFLFKGSPRSILVKTFGSENIDKEMKHDNMD